MVEARDDGRAVRPPLPLRLRPHRLVQPGDRRVTVVAARRRRRLTAAEKIKVGRIKKIDNSSYNTNLGSHCCSVLGLGGRIFGGGRNLLRLRARVLLVGGGGGDGGVAGLSAALKEKTYLIRSNDYFT